MQAATIAGLLGVLTAWSPHATAASLTTPTTTAAAATTAVPATMVPPSAFFATTVPPRASTFPPSMVVTSMACPAAQSDAHRPLLKSADTLVESGDDEQAARTFIAAFDAMDLADRVGNTGRFAVDRAVTSYIKAWRIQRDVGLLQEAEKFLLRYIDVLGQGKADGCNVVPKSWADEKLAEVRAEMPDDPEAPVETPKEGPKAPSKDCPQAAAIIGVDRVGVALVTIGASLFISGTAFLVVGLVDGDLSQNPGQGFAIAGGVIMGSGAAFLIPGAIRLGTWKRRQRRATRLGMAPFAGRGLAGLSLHGRFGARR